MNCFAKFEKFLPHSITIPSFMSVGGQMIELDRGLPPYKICSQNTQYNTLGLMISDKQHVCQIRHTIALQLKE